MLFLYYLDWGSWLTKTRMPWFSPSFLWSAALISTCKLAKQHTWLCKQTVMAVFTAQTNKLLLPTVQSFQIYKEVAKEEKNGQDENGKIFIHNSLASIMLYYTHIIMFRKVSHLSYALTRHCLWSSKRLVVSPWWRQATPPSTRWNLLCIINVLYFTTLCSQVALQVPWSIKFSYAAALWKQATIMAHW